MMTPCSPVRPFALHTVKPGYFRVYRLLAVSLILVNGTCYRYSLLMGTPAGLDIIAKYSAGSAIPSIPS